MKTIVVACYALMHICVIVMVINPCETAVAVDRPQYHRFRRSARNNDGLCSSGKEQWLFLC